MVLNLMDGHSKKGMGASEQRHGDLSSLAFHHSGSVFIAHTIPGSSIALGNDTPSPLRENPVCKASVSPVSESTKSNGWKAELVLVATLALMPMCITANTTDNCSLGTQHTQCKHSADQTKVEDIFQGPGTAFDADPSSLLLDDSHKQLRCTRCWSS